MTDYLRSHLVRAALAYLDRVQGALRALPADTLGALVERLLVARSEERTVFVFGNGGSASTASHIAVDFSKTAHRPAWPRLRTFALNDNVPLVTAWANDADYSQVFAEQLRAYARPGDIALAISGSGNSPNIVSAVQAARELGLFTIGFLGFDGGRVRELVHLPIVVPLHEYGPVEDVHLVLNHLVTAVMNEIELTDLASLAATAAQEDGPAGAARVYGSRPLSNGAHAPRALVLCAGEGTRLRPLTLTRPKALVEVAGTPLLVHLLRWLRRSGIAEVAVNVHYLPDAIPELLGSGHDHGVQLTVSREEELLGTAGALRPLASWLTQTFVVVYGDLLTDVDLTPLLQVHRTSGALCTLGLSEVDDPTRAGIVVRDPAGWITQFVEKPDAAQAARLRPAGGTLWASAGIYVMEPAVLQHLPASGPVDFGHDLFPRLLEHGAGMQSLPLDGYLLDIGSLERLAQAEADVRAGAVRVDAAGTAVRAGQP